MDTSELNNITSNGIECSFDETTNDNLNDNLFNAGIDISHIDDEPTASNMHTNNTNADLSMTLEPSEVQYLKNRHNMAHELTVANVEQHNAMIDSSDEESIHIESELVGKTAQEISKIYVDGVEFERVELDPSVMEITDGEINDMQLSTTIPGEEHNAVQYEIQELNEMELSTMNFSPFVAVAQHEFNSNNVEISATSSIAGTSRNIPTDENLTANDQQPSTSRVLISMDIGGRHTNIVIENSDSEIEEADVLDVCKTALGDAIIDYYLENNEQARDVSIDIEDTTPVTNNATANNNNLQTNPTNNMPDSTAIDMNEGDYLLVETDNEDEEDDSDDEERVIVIDEPVVPDNTNCGENSYFQFSIYEVARRVWPTVNMDTQHFTKGCMWSPDGLCLLTAVNMDGMHVLEMPPDLCTFNYNADNSLQREMALRDMTTLRTALHVPEGGTVYDFAWYPFMQSFAPETCCWLSTRQHEPIHMWDAYNGEIRCSYRGYNTMDEAECAISIAFSNDGEKIFGGYKKSIKIFETSRPSRDFTLYPTKQPTSCFATTPENNFTVTAGSWNKCIYHFDLRDSRRAPLFVLEGHTGGITWLRYATATGIPMLFSGARKDNQLLQWDMRNYTRPVRTFERNVATNQRIYFDLSPEQKWLISGDTDGFVHIWSLTDSSKEYHIKVHKDCCNGVSFHPCYPIIASSAGQYHYIDTENYTDNAEVEIVYENSIVMGWIQARLSYELD